jgi:hypothetical protein
MMLHQVFTKSAVAPAVATLNTSDRLADVQVPCHAWDRGFAALAGLKVTESIASMGIAA